MDFSGTTNYSILDLTLIMPINYSYPSGAPTGNEYLDSLIWGGSLAAGANQPTTITWTTGGGEYAMFNTTQVWTDAWSSTELAILRSALQQWDDVCNLNFSYVTDPKQADLQEFKISSSSMRLATGISNVVASHEIPGDSKYTVPLYGFFNDNLAEWTTGLQQGGTGFKALIHEIGHGLGLAHPHDGGGRPDATKFPGVTSDFGSYGQDDMNQGIWTVESYNDGWKQQPSSGYTYGSEGTPMALDIATIQYIYGANTEFHTGNDTYQLASTNGTGTYWSSIWDAGGDDVISAQGVSTASTINLNAAPLVGTNAGGYVSYVSGITGGFTIANGVTIENATGGNGSDMLVGNDAANLLTGGDGNDTLTGGAGNDVFIYAASGNGTDTITDFAIGDVIRIISNTFSSVITTGDGNSTGANHFEISSNGNTTTLYIGTNNQPGADIIIQLVGTYAIKQFVITGSDISLINLISGTDGNDKLTGTSGAERLSGEGGNDTLDGGAGNDILDGGTGSDKMIGRTGDDSYYVDAKSDTVTEKVSEGMDTVISSISYTLGKEIEILELMSGMGNISGTGNKSNNTLTGNEGDNTLNGKEGNDILIGGAGTDTFVFDTKLGIANIDTISDFVSGTDDISLSKKLFGKYKAGDIPLSYFVSGANPTAQNATDHFLYNTSTGALSYDADGNGIKSAAVQFATLTGYPTLLASDLYIF